MDTYAYDHNLPCRNPNCKSHGRPHPNCQCYGGGGEGDYLAHGGSVCATNSPHQLGCVYYADGGSVDDTATTKGHAAHHHGLLNMLTRVGHSKLADPEKHTRLLDDTKQHLSRLQDPVDSQYEPKKTTGVKLANSLAEGDTAGAADVMQGHPLVAGMGKTHLAPILHRMAGPMMSQEANPESFRNSVEYLGSAVKGHQKLKAQASDLLGKQLEADRIKPDKDEREALKSHIDMLSKNPEKLLDVGGSLGHYLPEQSAQLTTMAGAATQYLNSLKPKPLQLAAMDSPVPPDRASMADYNRQVDIAQQPALILQHVKDGTLIPQDLKTVQTIFPGLYKSMVQEAGEALIAAKTDKREVPYKQKIGLSMLLGQPMDSTLSPMSMQAIMHSQGAQQAQQQAKSPKKATDVELKQIDKADSMAETPLDSRQIDKKSDA